MPEALSRNQSILRFDVILQHDWPVEQCLLHIRVFFGGKTKSLCFDLFIHWLIKQITNSDRNHFSRSYENRSKRGLIFEGWFRIQVPCGWIGVWWAYVLDVFHCYYCLKRNTRACSWMQLTRKPNESLFKSPKMKKPRWYLPLIKANTVGMIMSSKIGLVQLLPKFKSLLYCCFFTSKRTKFLKKWKFDVYHKLY